MAEFTLRGITLHIPDHLLTDNIAARLNNKRYESGEAHAIKQHLCATDRVLEFGGGAGFITTLIAKTVAPNRVMTVEANKKMIAVIADNLALNNVAGVELVHAAVVPDDYQLDTVTFHNTRAYLASSTLPTRATKNPKTQRNSVPAVKISDLLQDQAPTFVVMDIEGMEFALFETPWPDSVRLLVIELHPDVYNEIAIKRIFDQLSLAGFAYCPTGSQGAVVVFKRVTNAP